MFIKRIAIATTALAAALPAPALALSPESGRLTKRAPMAAMPRNPFTFVGTTAQRPCRFDSQNVFCGGVNLFMSRDMKRVKRLIVGFEATCQQPDMFFGTNIVLSGIPAKASKRGSSFQASGPMDTELTDDLTAHVEVGVSGRAKLGSTGHGTFSITIGIFDGSGQQIDSCQTGRQSFDVRALKRR
jgi:hypothetical protein